MWIFDFVYSPTKRMRSTFVIPSGTALCIRFASIFQFLRSPGIALANT